jgi:hypothetical protein
MIKLCVGCDSVEELIEWHREERAGHQPWIMQTRQTPKRAAELVEGGSLYRVYKGMILSRQKILAIDTVGEGVATRCQMTLDLDVVLVAPTPRRAFQGWRYFEEKDVPPDLGRAGEDAVPQSLARALREVGAW